MKLYVSPVYVYIYISPRLLCLMKLYVSPVYIYIYISPRLLCLMKLYVSPVYIYIYISKIVMFNETLCIPSIYIYISKIVMFSTSESFFTKNCQKPQICRNRNLINDISIVCHDATPAPYTCTVHLPFFLFFVSTVFDFLNPCNILRDFIYSPLWRQEFFILNALSSMHSFTSVYTNCIKCPEFYETLLWHTVPYRTVGRLILVLSLSM